MRTQAFALAFSASLLCWPLAACGGSSSSTSAEESTFDEADARVDAAADLSATTYEAEEGSFACTEDCSGHDAGWAWAAENSVTDAFECAGSGSFQEGCEAYAAALEARVEEAEDEARIE